ncbi:MAG: hypothetical protein ACYCWN_07810 [Ferrimicrobium sp.]|jgi:hypothetical protein|uniref:DUF8094 domain-containing protein n=1 Tax=Ferrimicrobium acidiphilum TaxID=121039 RepID=A0ABV3Y2G0_9ACTN|nr:hypothetical protein [Ferrimicrobium sp.]
MLSAVLLASCSQTSTATVTLSSSNSIQANYARIVSRYSTANNQANETLSVAKQNNDEQGTAAAIDNADFYLSRDAGYQTAQGATYKPFYERLDHAVAIGASQKYPKLLLTVDAQYTTAPQTANRSACRFLGIFAKDSPSAPWRVTDEPTVTKALLPEVKTTNGNRGITPATTAALSIPLSRLAKYYALALTTYYQQGVLSRGLKSADFQTSAPCWSLPRLATNPYVSPSSSQQLATSATVTAPHPAMVALSTANAGALTIFTLHVDLITSSPRSTTFTWRHSATNPDSFLLPASSGLHNIQIPLLFNLAVYDPPVADTTVAPRVIGSYWGPLLGGIETHKAPLDT